MWLLSRQGRYRTRHMLNHHVHLQRQGWQDEDQIVYMIQTLVATRRCRSVIQLATPTDTRCELDTFIITIHAACGLLHLHIDAFVSTLLQTTAMPLRTALSQPEQSHAPRSTSKTDHVFVYCCLVSSILERQPQKSLRVAQHPLALY
jgi:hypothetical protein